QRDKFFVREAKPTSRLMMGANMIVQLTLLGVMLHADYPIWRIGALLGLFAAFVVGHRIIIARTRDSHRVEHAFIGMNVIAQLFVVGSTGLTGGVRSPLLPGTVMPAIVSLLFFGPQSVSRWMALGNFLFIVAMVSLPQYVVGPALPSAHYAVAIILNLSWNLF